MSAAHPLTCSCNAGRQASTHGRTPPIGSASEARRAPPSSWVRMRRTHFPSPHDRHSGGAGWGILEQCGTV
eukprot:8142861-Alexandrium_andersonii.AAC.1